MGCHQADVAGIFWALRSGGPWRDLPEAFGPYTTCYNRFVSWRRAGVWGRIIDALASWSMHHETGRSRGGLTSKIHAAVDGNGLPVRLALTPSEAHDVRLAGKLLSRLKSGSMLLADRGYDTDLIRALAMKKGAWPTSRRKAIAAIRSALALISTVLATRSSGSSTGSSNVVVWRHSTIGLPLITLPSFNSLRSGVAAP
jgi:transposase